ncbi:phosphatase PAP2 family protein [Micromonospora robiginosa]|uniref:Phosphatase PAP2 family protein n=1 Tax=Micromonospora robiginosa TaxID=2749844 RepID=A0A7L6AZD2_9ACTN|nr:phosphatase PAP2 family protein [Micromonospora ferruginea]QLQ34941.1 phosphatase PAP2 family protein [Micromonospora ferruginea]
MNYHLFQMINAGAGRVDALDDVFEWAAIWLIYVLGALAVVPVLRRGRSAAGPVLRMLAALGIAFALGRAAAALSTEVRPFQTHHVHQLIPHATGPSLPSDHATAAFTLAFAVGAFLSRRWGVALAALAAVIGFARVWTGVHYPGDIAAGALLAAGAVGTVVVAARLHGHRSRPDRV